MHLLAAASHTAQHCASTPQRDCKIAPTMMLVLLLLHAAAAKAKIRGVRVLAVGTKPELGGPLNTQAAQKAQNKDVTYIKKKKPRKALAHDAARWFGSRGYVVDDVGVNTQTVGDDDLVVLSARVLPCGPIRLRAANGTHVRTKPATVARALGLRKGQPFRWDPTRLAALIREDGGLFKPDATRARASVEDGVVALDLTVAEPPYRTITPELDVDADRARAFLRVQDRNLLGTGCEGEVEASCTRKEAPELAASLAHRGLNGRGWSARVKPLGLKSLSTRFDGRRANTLVDVEEVQDGAISSLTLAKRRFGSAWRLQLGQRSRRGPFGRVGLAWKRGPFETYASVGRGKPLQERGLAAPRLYEHVGKDRKDALADEFDGGLIGARVEVDRRVRDGFLSVFADACAAKDWGAERVTDAAYGVSASYSLLRVDVTKRLFGGKARPAVTLRLADGVGGVRCP